MRRGLGHWEEEDEEWLAMARIRKEWARPCLWKWTELLELQKQQISYLKLVFYPTPLVDYLFNIYEGQKWRVVTCLKCCSLQNKRGSERTKVHIFIKENMQSCKIYHFDQGKGQPCLKPPTLLVGWVWLAHHTLKDWLIELYRLFGLSFVGLQIRILKVYVALTYWFLMLDLLITDILIFFHLLEINDKKVEGHKNQECIEISCTRTKK